MKCSVQPFLLLSMQFSIQWSWQKRKKQEWKVLQSHRLRNKWKICTADFWQSDISHWPILGWNVSKSWLQKVDFFENYAIVAMQSDNITFYACKIIKGTSGFNLKKTNFFARWRQHPKNSWNIFQIQITPLLWCPQEPQGRQSSGLKPKLAKPVTV